MPKRILFVDDEPEFVRPQITALEEAGFDVEFAERPDEALKLLEKESYDLIVLDVIMPPVNIDENVDKGVKKFSELEAGVDFHRKIVEIDLLRDVPILFLTVVRDQHIRNDLIESERKRGHRARFLTKPVRSLQVFVEEVEKALKEVTERS